MEQGLRLNVRNETVVIVILIIQDICFILGISHNFWNNLLFPKIIFYIKLRETPSIFLDSLKLPKKNSMQKKCAKVSIYLIKYVINVYKFMYIKLQKRIIIIFPKISNYIVLIIIEKVVKSFCLKFLRKISRAISYPFMFSLYKIEIFDKIFL